MGQYVRWQTIIACCGMLLLVGYLGSIVVTTTSVTVPAEGGTYREGIIGKPYYLNPLLATYNSVDQDIVALIFQGLVRDNGRGDIEPVLAEYWTLSEDGTEYIFTLRKDVYWSDGMQFVSDDVLFTYNLIQSPMFSGNPSWQKFWQSIEIEKIDDYTLRFRLSVPLASFIHYATVGILPHHLLQNISPELLLTHPFNLNPVGTGPFKLVEGTDRHVLVARNVRYWGQAPRVEKIEFKFYDSTDTIQKAFLAGELDGIGQVPIHLAKELEQLPNVQIFNAPLTRYHIIYLNHQRPEQLPFFQNVALRQALSLLLDRQAMIDDVLDGVAIPASGPIHPWNWAYNAQQIYPANNFDEALTRLEANGWFDSDGDGIREKQDQLFAFTLLTSNASDKIAVAHQVAAQWQKAGVQVNIQVSEDNLLDRLRLKNFEAALVEIQHLGDPDSYHLWHYTQIEQGQNFAGWDNPEASFALERGRTTITQIERIQPYYEFQRIFAQEMPTIILYHPIYIHILKDTVKNVQIPILVNASGRFQNIQDWYLLTHKVFETNTNPSLIFN